MSAQGFSLAVGWAPRKLSHSGSHWMHVPMLFGGRVFSSWFLHEEVSGQSFGSQTFLSLQNTCSSPSVSLHPSFRRARILPELQQEG